MQLKKQIIEALLERNNKYDILLLEESKRGRKNSYMNLSNIYNYHVFSLVFKLVPVKDEAIKITGETFLVTWRNFSRIEVLDDFKKMLEHVAVLRCVDYLSKHEKKPLDSYSIKLLEKQFNNHISKIERDIITLPLNERIIVVLSDELGLTASTISKFYPLVKKKEIPIILNETRKTLITSCPSEYFFNYTEKQWGELFFIIEKINKSLFLI